MYDVDKLVAKIDKQVEQIDNILRYLDTTEKEFMTVANSPYNHWERSALLKKLKIFCSN